MYATKLSQSFLDSYATKTPAWGPLGYLIYKRTYARPYLDRKEEWHETCARICNTIVEVGDIFTEHELEQLYDIMFNFKGLPAGRILWQLGSKTMYKLGADSQANCWVVCVNNLEAFTFTFDKLLLGGGVGFNILPQHVYELPLVKYNIDVKDVHNYDCDFIIPDNREGWVETLHRILQAFFVTGKNFYYSSVCVRPAGTPMKSFGGYASGATNLVTGLTHIVKVLKLRVGKKLRPVDVLDIMNILGVIGINSGAKRTSELALGDVNDPFFMNAKNRKQGLIPNWRVMSNNSISCSNIENLTESFWEQFNDGDPYGLVNLNNCKRFGRLLDGIDYRPDYQIVGVNPCGEFCGSNKEPCNLADIFLPNITNKIEFLETARLLYKVCKTITTMPFSGRETQTIVSQNHKLGIGLTGWMAVPQFHDAELLSSVYKMLEESDKEYSQQLNCGLSKRLTVIKPSGTLSLLPRGITPGIHAAFSRYMIRRVRFSSDDPLVETCYANGYPVEPRLELNGDEDINNVVISFPIDMGPNVITDDQMSVIDELEQQKFLQTYWTDQAISCSHYYRREEIPDIKNWLGKNYNDSVKTCSFLLANEHKFLQAPIEKINEETYLKMTSKIKPITKIVDGDLQESFECSTGSCPIK